MFFFRKGLVIWTVIWLAVTVMTPFLYGQTLFAKGSSIDDSNFLNGRAAWGDYNNDGNLDVIQIGTPSNFSKTKLFKNNGNGTFTEIQKTGIGNFGIGDVAWGDYNLDGLLDVILVGREVFNFDPGKEKTGLYKNLGGDKFLEVKTDFPNLGTGSVEWIDFDNDGDLDVMLSGNPDYKSFVFNTVLFRNDGQDNFTKVDVPFDKVSQSDIAWGDFDNDGDKDLAIAGWDSFAGITKIYRNNGGSKFSLFQILEPAMRSALDWGDYNNDGLLDLVVSGFNGSRAIFNIYKNVDNKEFSKISDPNFLSKAGEQGNTLWFDYDRDGDLDIIASITGTTPSQQAFFNTLIYTNLGNDIFVQAENTGLPEDFSPVTLVDIDKDGDLDVYFLSVFKSQSTCTFFINNSKQVVYYEAPPNQLLVKSEQDRLVLGWNDVSEKGKYTMTYNVYLRKGKDTLVASNSVFKGDRKLLQIGNAELRLNFPFQKLQSGEYCWSVQSINKSYKGSIFAKESCFKVSPDGGIEIIESDNLVTSKNENQRAELSVFPIPAIDKLFIQGLQMKGIINIELMDSVGKSILQTTSMDDEEFLLDLRGLPEGFYLLHLRGSSLSLTKRIVISR